MNNIYDFIMDEIRVAVEERFGGNMKQAASAWGIPNDNLNKWLNGTRSPKLKHLAPILEKLGMQFTTPNRQLDEFAMVPKVKAKAGAGSSFETDSDVEGYYAFRHSFLDREHIHGDKCKMMQVIGESMSPLIPDGSTVLIDTSDSEPRDGKIFVVRLDEEVLVKRLQKIPGGWQLVSESQNFAPIPVMGEQGPSFEIVGRVRWFGRVLD